MHLLIFYKEEPCHTTMIGIIPCPYTVCSKQLFIFLNAMVLDRSSVSADTQVQRSKKKKMVWNVSSSKKSSTVLKDRQAATHPNITGLSTDALLT